MRSEGVELMKVYLIEKSCKRIRYQVQPTGLKEMVCDSWCTDPECVWAVKVVETRGQLNDSREHLEVMMTAFKPPGLS